MVGPLRVAMKQYQVGERGRAMKCEICGEETATMWVERPTTTWSDKAAGLTYAPQLSCPDCGPQLGYKTLAPLVANIRSDAD